MLGDCVLDMGLVVSLVLGLLGLLLARVGVEIYLLVLVVMLAVGLIVPILLIVGVLVVGLDLVTVVMGGGVRYLLLNVTEVVGCTGTDVVLGG